MKQIRKFFTSKLSVRQGFKLYQSYYLTISIKTPLSRLLHQHRIKRKHYCILANHSKRSMHADGFFARHAEEVVTAVHRLAIEATITMKKSI